MKVIRAFGLIEVIKVICITRVAVQLKVLGVLELIRNEAGLLPLCLLPLPRLAASVFVAAPLADVLVVVGRMGSCHRLSSPVCMPACCQSQRGGEGASLGVFVERA